MVKIISPSPTDWDAFVRVQPRGHILQLAAWGELKRAYGWGVRRIAMSDDDGQIVAGAQILLRKLPARVLGSMAYVGMGPYISAGISQRSLWEVIRKGLGRNNSAAFIKWEPGIYTPDEPQPDIAALGFHISPQTVQPPRTILINIDDDDDAILARMNQGTRRKIRQSLKNDIHYYEASPDDVRKFTDLMTATGSRNAFGVHEAGYYQLAYKLFVQNPNPDAALILAEHDGDVLAGVFVFALGKTAWYFYGASSDVKRNLMASYGVQWAAIQWAKRRGCTSYDLWGIPDEDEPKLEAEFQDRSDGLWGVYGFKRGWGGQVVRSLGAWDKAYNSLIYRTYWGALKVQEIMAQQTAREVAAKKEAQKVTQDE